MYSPWCEIQCVHLGIYQSPWGWSSHHISWSPCHLSKGDLGHHICSIWEDSHEFSLNFMIQYGSTIGLSITGVAVWVRSLVDGCILVCQYGIPWSEGCWCCWCDGICMLHMLAV